MAKPSIAASNTARNKSVLEFARVFKCVLEYVTDNTSNRESKSNCLQSLETFIDFGYKAVKERGINSDIESYQKHFQSYIYHSSVYLEKHTQAEAINRLEHNDRAFVMAQSLANMLLLAVDAFAQLGNLGYYQDFAQAVKTLFECVGGEAGLLPDAAKLVKSALRR